MDALYYNYFNPRRNYGLTRLAPLVVGTVFIPLSVAFNLIGTFLVCVCLPGVQREQQERERNTTPTPSMVEIPTFYTNERDGIALGISDTNQSNVIIVVNPKN
jgi:hypothetical protein